MTCSKSAKCKFSIYGECLMLHVNYVVSVVTLPAKKKSVPKMLYINEAIFSPWDSFEVSWNGHCYTTNFPQFP